MTEVITGPWRATRLWNDLIRNFHTGMPTKKHRKNLKTFESCFSGSEALDWLYKHLKKNPNFGPDVTRDQSGQLLRKILRARVMEPVDPAVGDEFSSTELYRIVPSAVENLHSPGKARISPKPMEHKRRVFSNLLNTPTKLQTLSKKTLDITHELKAETECSDSDQKSLNKMKKELNRSYFQSLPPNSLIVLDNDKTWKQEFLSQLRSTLSEAHINSLNINVSYIIYNMTKVSSKGIVQLTNDKDSLDLPHWVLSAMKCLANWPRPMKMLNGEETSMPNYPTFIIDVFNVVRDYFLGLRSPLVPYELFDMFISAHIKAEAISATKNPPKVLPKPSLDARRTQSGNLFQTSTPTHYEERKYYDMRTGYSPNYERLARIRPTHQVQSPQSSFEGSESQQGLIEAGGHNLSSTAVMRSVLPPNSCFETAFMNENPVTRIVKQKDSETLHLNNSRFRSLSRASCYTPIPSDLDTRSIATQTSQDTESLHAHGRGEVMQPTLNPLRRQTRWRRSTRQRRSIAVMDSFKDTMSAMDVPVTCKTNYDSNRSSSVDNLLDEKDNKFLKKYKMAEDLKLEDHVIFSKAVRKEKKKQQVKKKERAISEDRFSSFRSTSSYSNPKNYYSTNYVRYHTSSYNNLTVKTPMYPSMQCVRAEPCKVSPSINENRILTQEGVETAIDSFKLLALLLPPSNRRRLQLLLKFMKRVSCNSQLSLIRGGTKTNLCLVLDTFTHAILKPIGMSHYDEELCRKIVKFFVFHYDSVWMPPESLRRDVEEKVYQSLVSRRIKAGQDPYPITFCKQISSKSYDQERDSAVHVAMRDLLEQIVSTSKLSLKEKRKKLKRFKEAYPKVWLEKFPEEADEPEVMTAKTNLSAIEKISSFTKLKGAMRI